MLEFFDVYQVILEDPIKIAGNFVTFFVVRQTDTETRVIVPNKYQHGGTMFFLGEMNNEVRELVTELNLINRSSF